MRFVMQVTKVRSKNKGYWAGRGKIVADIKLAKKYRNESNIKNAYSQLKVLGSEVVNKRKYFVCFDELT